MTTYDIFMHYYNDNIGKAVTNLTKCEWHSCLTPAPEGSNHVYMELSDMNESRIDEGTEALETLYISGTDTTTDENTNIYEDYIVKALTVNNPKYDMIFVYDGLGYYNSQQGTSEDRLLNKIFNLSVNGKIFKKSILNDIYFEEDLLKYENIDFLNKVLKNVNEYLFTTDLIYTFNQIPNSLINTLGVDNLCFIDSLKKINIEKFDVNTINDEFLYVMFEKILKNNKNIDENYIIINENLEKFIGIVGYDNLKMTVKRIKRKLKNEKKSKIILLPKVF